MFLADQLARLTSDGLMTSDKEPVGRNMIQDPAQWLGKKSKNWSLGAWVPRLDVKNVT